MKVQDGGTLPRQVTIDSIVQSELREILRQKKARFRRNTLCISRSRNELMTQNIRKAPQAH
ncbi:MAG: hypothetical protein ACI4O5_06635 [Oscillospiraceae bacterium]